MYVSWHRTPRLCAGTCCKISARSCALSCCCLGCKPIISGSSSNTTKTQRHASQAWNLTLKLLSPPLRTETPEPVLCYAARTALKPTAPHVFTGELNFFKNLLQVTHWIHLFCHAVIHPLLLSSASNLCATRAAEAKCQLLTKKPSETL